MSSPQEPAITAAHREQLAYLLTEAAEIEHGLMCCYLYAAYSLKTPADGLSPDDAAMIARWRSGIVSIAVEEMLHLALVSNLLTAIGFAPRFARPNFPVAPGYHPSGVVVALAPFSAATLDHFVFLERPEGVELPDGAGFEPPVRFVRGSGPDRLVPSSEDFLTVGHLYRGIGDAFVKLAGLLGERALFVGDANAQITPAQLGLPGMTAVTDLASAVRAIETIVTQGEGTQAHVETSHYRRFVAIRDEYRAVREKRPDFAPAHPAARNPVMRRPPTPDGLVWVDEPVTALLLDHGNAVYEHALRILGRAFGQAEDTAEQRGVLLDVAIDLMTMMTPVAQELARLPASPSRPGVNAGLTFTISRSVLAADQCAAWPLLLERTRDLARAFASLTGGDAAAHALLANRLDAAADKLAAASPVKTNAPAAVRPPVAAPIPAAAPTPEPTAATETSAAPAIEEARGKKLLLRFETKRCIHSRHCVLGAPKTFRANVKGPWIDPDATSVEGLLTVAHDCPSGAITYERLDGGEPEPAPEVNVLRIRENGPLAVNAAIDLEGRGKMLRATLCRCGASKNKPFCDGSHHAKPFVATGEPATQNSDALPVRDGALAISPLTNGPLDVKGNLEIVSGTGRTVTRVVRTRLCRCGGSANKPFCDGTHARIGFRSDV